MRVVGAVDTETERMAAALDDVVEDTPMTLGDLAEAGCPPEVLAAVDVLTRRPGEPYVSFLGRVAENELARSVKIGDLIDNSDEKRLELLAPEEAERLRSKYAAAIAALGATEQVVAWRKNNRGQRSTEWPR